MTHDAEAVALRPPFPVDPVLTLGAFRCGGADPTFAVDGGTVWRALSTPDGAATIRVASRADGRLHVRAWGPGRHAALASMPAMLGFDDDDRDYALQQSLEAWVARNDAAGAAALLEGRAFADPVAGAAALHSALITLGRGERFARR